MSGIIIWCYSFSMISLFFFLMLCALASRDELQSRKVKLDYDEVGTCQKDVINVWDKKLLNCRAKIRCDMEDIHGILKEGIYTGWLLAIKSGDLCCCCPFILKEIHQQYPGFGSRKSWKKLHIPPHPKAVKLKVGGVMSERCGAFGES